MALSAERRRHAFIFNLAPRRDGSWGAIVSRKLYKAQKLACARPTAAPSVARSAEPEEAVGKPLIRGERLRSRMCGSLGV
jgi:hypothetical protein